MDDEDGNSAPRRGRGKLMRQRVVVMPLKLLSKRPKNPQCYTRGTSIQKRYIWRLRNVELYQLKCQELLTKEPGRDF